MLDRSTSCWVTFELCTDSAADKVRTDKSEIDEELRISKQWFMHINNLDLKIIKAILYQL